MLSGTFELFALADVLGLIERAGASGALVVRGREIDGSLYFVDGRLCGGEIGDLSGPVEGRQALEIRLLEVIVPLLRARSADFEFRVDVTPAWPAAVDVPVEVVLEPAERIAREWSSIMTAIESFESALERTGQITTDSITLTHLGFRVLELVDGTTSIRDLARRAGVSLVAVAPEVRQLVLAGAVRVVVDADRALATARADAERDRPAVDGAVDVTAAPPPPLPEPARPREPVAVAAGSVDPAPPVPVAPAAEPAVAAPQPPESPPEPERAQIVVDRSELLRMFSGLKDE
ncbi:MAG: DUF4388 domain-containing protein [Acidimicrobiia bacterium]